jgi:hypothetical protein
MKSRYLIPLSLILFSYARVTDYGFIIPTDYEFVNQKHHWHVDGDYRRVGKAKFTTKDVKGSHLKYSDAYGNAYYSYFFNPCNSISLQAGYTHVGLDWDQNPRFSETEYNYGTASIGWVSNSLTDWRWVLSGGASVDTHSWNFGRTGVYNMMMWGRYNINCHLGMHVGFWGYAGIQNVRVVPILGLDWSIGRNWSLHAIYPLDISLQYAFNKQWSACVALAGFGGPYRYPMRARGGKGQFHSPITQINSTGVEFDLDYSCGSFLSAGIGAGWNFGGWMLIRNGDNHHGKYYKFNSAPYAQANLAISF